MSSDDSGQNHLEHQGWRRGARLMSLPLGYMGRGIQGLGRRVAGESSADVGATLSEANARHVFAVLGELKGGAMKIGQIMSLLAPAMPEHLAQPYAEHLRRLQTSAPPMARSRVAEVMATQFGPDWRSLFTDFSWQPSAAASIGQVHRATWAASGEDVAVKIQYPGAEEALRSDLRALERMAGVLAPVAGGMDIRAIVRETAARIGEEVDYEAEAHAQSTAARAFASDPEVCVPKVVAHTSRLIVSSWVDGQPLSTVADAPASERNAWAYSYARFLFRCAAVSGLLHADPHPGNFHVLPDGRLAVLDWGLAARLPDGLPHSMGVLLRLAADGDARAVNTGLRDLGFVTRDVDPTVLLDYLAPFVEPAAKEEFEFSPEWLRSQVERVGADKRQARVVSTLDLPLDYLLIHRVWFGGVAVLCSLRCRARFREILDEFLPGWRERSR